MADTLLIQYSLEHPDNVAWSQVNNQGELTSKITQGALTDAAALAATSSKVVVLLDSTSLHLNRVKLPTQNRSKMSRAIPYALEEQIADDIDDFHFVFEKPANDDKTPVVGINSDTLDDLLNTFDNAGIFLDAIVPDTLCLIADSHQWAILYHEDKVFIQLDSLFGGQFDRDMLPVVLESTLKQNTENLPEKIIVFSTEGNPADDLSAIVSDEIEIISINYNTHPMVVFCGQYSHAMPLNLLQYKYKPKNKNSFDFGKWTLAASLAGIWLCLHLGSIGFEYFTLAEKNKQISAEITNIYKKSFPQSKRVVDARKQMEKNLNELKGNSSAGGSSMIGLLTDSAGALAKDKSIDIETINYRNNRMDLGLVSKNLQAIESLNKALNNSEIKSEITSSTSEKERVKGNIRLQGAET